MPNNPTPITRVTDQNEASKTGSRKLSSREWEIVTLIVLLAKTNKEIAHDLNITEGTVKEYLYRIFVKLGLNARNRGVLALWWHQSGTWR